VYPSILTASLMPKELRAEFLGRCIHQFWKLDAGSRRSVERAWE
jgi:hypothetical protein